MTFGVANIDRATLINNVTLLAKVAKEFNIPAVLTAVETESFSGYIWPQLLDVFPGQPVVERTSMNSWDDAGFRAAIEATGKKNILMTGLWTEVCVTWPTIEMLGAGYNIYVVEDCCGATSQAAHEAALSRMVQAGAVRVTTIPPCSSGSATGRSVSTTTTSWASSRARVVRTAWAWSTPTPWCTRLRSRPSSRRWCPPPRIIDRFLQLLTPNLRASGLWTTPCMSPSPAGSGRNTSALLKRR